VSGEMALNTSTTYSVLHGDTCCQAAPTDLGSMQRPQQHAFNLLLMCLRISPALLLKKDPVLEPDHIALQSYEQGCQQASKHTCCT